MKTIKFRGQISPIMSAIRMGSDVTRISIDVPLTERENVIGLLALTDHPLKFEISVDGTPATQLKKEKGEHGQYWYLLFHDFGFQSNLRLIDTLGCELPIEVRPALHRVFNVESLSEVSPGQFEDWCTSEGLHSLITLSRQAQAKLAA